MRLALKFKVLGTFVFTVIFASNIIGQHVQFDGNYTGTVDSLLATLQARSGVTISYSRNKIDGTRVVSVGSGQVDEILHEVFPANEYRLETRPGKFIISKVTPDEQILVTVSGHIRDGSNGETLPAATVQAIDRGGDRQEVRGAAANEYGFYSISIPAQPHVLRFSYLGFTSREIFFSGAVDTVLDIRLTPGEQFLEEVVVVRDRYAPELREHTRSASMGHIHLNVTEMKSLPALLGEVDMIKTVQMLPGVNTLGEGATNFYVRGGDADQNLIILDEAPVYNPSHLLGFFSVFNQDALHNADFYKGNFSAKYGGRLSSVLDLRMKEGNSKKFSVSGGIGTAAARLTVEGPVVKDRSSFIISARRTYVDLFFKLSSDEFTRESKLYFYDLNAKFNYTFNENNRLFVSGYFGRDVNAIRSLQYLVDWGNATGTIRWNHIFGDKLFSNLSLIVSNYDYNIDLPAADQSFDWQAMIRDYSLKYDFTHYVSPGLTLQYGLQSTLHDMHPGESVNMGQNGAPTSLTLDHALYVSANHELTDRLSAEYGVRLSAFQMIGDYTSYSYGEGGSLLDSVQYDNDGIIKQFFNIEPRINLRYSLSDNLSVKAGYSRNFQYLNMLSNLALGFNVFDVWLPSSPNIAPQSSHQVAGGIYVSGQKRQFTVSVEGYYKWLDNQLDFRDHSTLILTPYLEGQILGGKGTAYGVEFMLRKETGRLQGWLGYTWSRSFIEIDGINNGKAYPTAYDQPHAVNLSATYRINRRWSVSGNFVYATGRPTTLPVETYWFDGKIVPVYGPRNSGRLPDYHRLDLSVNLYRRKTNVKNESYWTFGIYNIYNRKNAATAFVSTELEDLDLPVYSDKSDYYKLYLFGIVPSVTYNFKF